MTTLMPSILGSGSNRPLSKPASQAPQPLFGDLRIQGPLNPDPADPTSMANGYQAPYIQLKSVPLYEGRNDLIIINGIPVGSSKWVEGLSDSLMFGSFTPDSEFRRGLGAIARDDGEHPATTLQWLRERTPHYQNIHTRRGVFGERSAFQYWEVLKPWILKVVDQFSIVDDGRKEIAHPYNDPIGNSKTLLVPASQRPLYYEVFPHDWYRKWVPENTRRWLGGLYLDWLNHQRAQETEAVQQKAV